MIHPLQSILKRLARLRRFPALARHGEATFLLDPGNWIDNRIIAGAPYERRQLANAMAMIERRDLDLLVDIGANFGLYSVTLGLRPQIRTIVAFEPVRRNYAQLMGNAFANRLEYKLEAHRLGISDHAGRVAIHIDPESTGVSRLDVSTADRAASKFSETEEIEIARFDDVTSFSGRRAFVKIDVEGMAAQAIGGMARFLAANQCVIQAEVTTDAERAAIGSLCERDFVEITRIDNDVVIAHRSLAT